jgi:hypothetical protein
VVTRLDCEFLAASFKLLTGDIPIVFVGVGDPVGSRFVESLARPGGKYHRFRSHAPSMGGKWLEVLKETAPYVAQVLAIMHAETELHQAFWQSIEMRRCDWQWRPQGEVCTMPPRLGESGLSSNNDSLRLTKRRRHRPAPPRINQNSDRYRAFGGAEVTDLVCDGSNPRTCLRSRNWFLARYPLPRLSARRLPKLQSAAKRPKARSGRQIGQ